MPGSAYTAGVTLPKGLRWMLTTWRGRFIALVLLVQLLAPLGYYLGRHDPHDERWAWRMFSPDRMRTCAPTFTVDGARASLGGEFHEAWISIARRGRFRVLEAMAARLCHKHPGTEVRLSMTCTPISGPPEQFGGFDMCQVPEL